MTSAKIRPLKVVVLQEKEEKPYQFKYLIFRRIFQLFQSDLALYLTFLTKYLKFFSVVKDNSVIQLDFFCLKFII
jgi:hypothetical protein